MLETQNKVNILFIIEYNIIQVLNNKRYFKFWPYEQVLNR